MADYSPDVDLVRIHRRGRVLDPLHAFLGAMPAAYFLLAFLIDVTYVQSAYYIWPFFSVWLITAGLVAGGLAVLFGLVEWFVRRREAGRSRVRWHGLITIVALILGLFNAFIHSRDGWTSVVPEGIILSGITALLMIVAAFLGAASRRAA